MKTPISGRCRRETTHGNKPCVISEFAATEDDVDGFGIVLDPLVEVESALLLFAAEAPTLCTRVRGRGSFFT